jgi:hypothetical protein
VAPAQLAAVDLPPWWSLARPRSTRRVISESGSEKTGLELVELVGTKFAVTPSRNRHLGQLTSVATWRELNPEPQRAHLIIWCASLILRTSNQVERRSRLEW